MNDRMSDQPRQDRVIIVWNDCKIKYSTWYKSDHRGNELLKFWVGHNQSLCVRYERVYLFIYPARIFRPSCCIPNPDRKVLLSRRLPFLLSRWPPPPSFVDSLAASVGGSAVVVVVFLACASGWCLRELCSEKKSERNLCCIIIFYSNEIVHSGVFWWSEYGGLNCSSGTISWDHHHPPSPCSTSLAFAVFIVVGQSSISANTAAFALKTRRWWMVLVSRWWYLGDPDKWQTSSRSAASFSH